MLSIQEIKLLIEKLNSAEKINWSKFIKDIKTEIEELARVVDIYNNDQIDKIDKSKAWYEKDLNWREGANELISSPILEKEIQTKINQFSKMGNVEQNCLHIGPGYGTRTLYLRSWKNIYLLDVLNSCKSRIFKKFNPAHQKYLKFHLTEKCTCDNIPTNSMSFIFSWETFTFFTPQHINLYLKDIYRVMLPGGYALIHYADCNYEDDLNEAKRGYWNFNTKQRMCEMVKQNNFEIIETSQFKTKNNYIIFQKPGKENVVVYKSFQIPTEK